MNPCDPCHADVLLELANDGEGCVPEERRPSRTCRGTDYGSGLHSFALKDDIWVCINCGLTKGVMKPA